MTGRALAITGSVALSIATVALVARPFFSAGPNAPRQVTSSPQPDAANIDAVAQRAARADLHCPSTRQSTPRSTRHPADCGTLQLHRHQTTCTTTTRCTVDLIGTLDVRDLLVPVALTVTVVSTPTGWRAVQVAS